MIVNGEDRISELPDDILHGILSALPLKEAGRTSVVSPRWRNLWRRTSSLNFDAREKMQEIIEEDYDSENDHLTRKSVIGDEGDFEQEPDEMIVFPQELRNSHHPSLRSLCLKFVLVRGEDIACLLRNCPLLEQLFVSSSVVLTSLEVCGSSLALKRLEIRCCHELTSLKVSAPNLTTLYLSKIEGLVLEDVPKLVNVYFECAKILPNISCCFSQLEMLTLDVVEVLTPMFNFPEMLKLKKLVIMYTSSENRSPLSLVTSFFKSSPFLQELVFKQTWGEDAPEGTNRQIDHREKMCSHQHLSVVKFLGYSGCASDVELVNFFLKNCVALKAIVVDPRDLWFRSWSYFVPTVSQQQLENEQTTRNYAEQQLELLVPKHIGLVFR